MPHSVGEVVRFRWEEFIKDCDGSLYRVDRMVLEGVVTELLPEGRLTVSFEDPSWGRAVTTLSPTELVET